MPSNRPVRRHLFNRRTGKAVCGREVEPRQPFITWNPSDLTCGVCQTELTRWTRQLRELQETVHAKIWAAMLEDAARGKARKEAPQRASKATPARRPV